MVLLTRLHKVKQIKHILLLENLHVYQISIIQNHMHLSYIYMYYMWLTILYGDDIVQWYGAVLLTEVRLVHRT